MNINNLKPILIKMEHKRILSIGQFGQQYTIFYCRKKTLIFDRCHNEKFQN